MIRRTADCNQLYHTDTSIDETTSGSLRHTELGAEDAVASSDNDDGVAGEGETAVDVGDGDGFDGDVESVEDVALDGACEGSKRLLSVAERSFW